MTTLTNPATYLYLNPTLQARKLALDVEDATRLWNSGDPYARSLPTALPSLPSDFDPLVYLAENRDVIDVSSMNQVIYQALLNEGRDVKTLQRQASYHGTIFRAASLTETNTFVFTDPRYTVSACNMTVNDLVKISVNSNQEHIYGTVASVTSSGFSITPPNLAQYSDSSATYVVYGLRVYDVARLLYANLAQAYEAMPTPVAQTYTAPLLEKEFNVDLYHVLYPDSRLMSKSEAYVDYTDNWGAASYRITKAADLINIRAPGITYADLSVDGTLTTGGGLFVANGTTQVVSVRGPLVGASLYVSSCNLVADANQVIAGGGALRVTKQTLASGVDSSFSSNVTLKAGMSVAGTVVVGGSVSVAGGLGVTLSAKFASNVSVSLGLSVQQDSSADRLLAWTGIGIGASGGSPIPPTTGPSTGGVGGAGVALTDPLIVGTVIANSSLYVGAGPWMLTDTESGSGALTLHHPSMGAHSHVFDPSGSVGLNVPGWGATAMGYGLVANGDIFTTGAVVSQSDGRFKTDLKVINSPMQRLSGLTGYTYSSKTKGGAGERCTGVLAQDVMAVLPEAVHTDEEGVMSVAYGNLAGLFIEAMKEMRTELQELRRMHASTLSHESA